MRGGRIGHYASAIRRGHQPIGMILFPSPSRALKATQRVLKSGARFAALVFTTPDEIFLWRSRWPSFCALRGNRLPNLDSPEYLLLGEMEFWKD